MPQRRSRPPGDPRQEQALAAVQVALARLPQELRAAALAVPVIFEDIPSPELLGEEFEDDLLGLFVGDPHAEVGASSQPLPAQIFLFLENIELYATEAGTGFAEEVTVTYLHELGHYLGFDEDDLELRGLD